MGGLGPLLCLSALPDLLVTAGQQCRERLTLDAQSKAQQR